MLKLSIITICKNQPDILDTLKSVNEQTFKDFEWIIIDGGSKSDTLSKINLFKDNIDVLVSEPDSGIYNAMNKGIKLAKGEYILFLNGGDNLSSPDILEKVFSFNFNDDVVYGNANMVNSDNSFNHFWHVKDIKDKQYFMFESISHQATFIKKELFDKYGLYCEEYKICSDAEKFLIFLENGAKFKKIELTVANQKNDGISSVNRKKSVLEREKMIRNYYNKIQIRNGIYKTTNLKEKIFSIKNKGLYKCIFVLGFLIRINRFKNS